MKPYYSKQVIEHFLHPKNLGKLKDADGVGKVGNPACGDVMELFIKVEKKNSKEIIKDIKFYTLGCAAAIATSDMAYQDIVGELGDLPPIKIHCSVLAREGLKAAVEDYRKKSKK